MIRPSATADRQLMASPARTIAVPDLCRGCLGRVGNGSPGVRTCDPETERSAAIQRQIRDRSVERTRATAAPVPVASPNHHSAQPGMELVAISKPAELTAPFEKDVLGYVFSLRPDAQCLAKSGQPRRRARIAFIELLSRDRDPSRAPVPLCDKERSLLRVFGRRTLPVACT
jgi:hypothetical protein